LGRHGTVGFGASPLRTVRSRIGQAGERGRGVQSRRAAGFCLLVVCGLAASLGLGWLGIGAGTPRHAVSRVVSRAAPAHGTLVNRSADLSASASRLGGRRSGPITQVRSGVVLARAGSPGLEARLSAAGAIVSGSHGSARIALLAFSAGAGWLRAGRVLPTARGGVAGFDRRGLVEWWASQPDGLEQGFDVSAPAQRSDGRVRLVFALTGALGATLRRGTVEFAARRGAAVLRYGGLSAIDARGRALPARLVLHGSRLSIVVDARGARFPVRIDPAWTTPVTVTGSGAEAIAVRDNGATSDANQGSIPLVAYFTQTTTSVSSSANPSQTGATVTYTATVAPTPTADPTDGTVSFDDGTGVINGCTGVPVSNGTATCSQTYGTPGSHAITATYSGNRLLDPSTSQTLTQNVVSPASTPTTTALTSSENPSFVGGTVTYTAQVSPVPDAGAVNFADYSGGFFICQNVNLSAAGTATCTQTYTSASTLTISAAYLGDTDYASSHALLLTQQILPAAPPTVTAVNPNSGPDTGGTKVVITGTHLTGATAVKFGHVPAQKVTPVSETEIKAVAPAGSPGTVDVTVTTPAGTSAISSADHFTYSHYAVELSKDSGHSYHSSVTITSTPCAAATDVLVHIKEQSVAGNSKLTISGDGDTSGLHASFDKTSVPDHGTTTLKVTSSNDGDGNPATYTITATNPHTAAAKATLVVDRAAATVQGLYVTQGTQYDSGHLNPSGAGQSGKSYGGVTLVAGKKTVVRLYANAAQSSVSLHSVVALLYGYHNGHPLPGSPLRAYYGPLTAAGKPETTLPNAGAGAGDVVSDAELESNANAYTFNLPSNWDSGPPNPDTIKLVGTVEPVSGTGSSCQGREQFTLKNLSFQYVGGNFNEALTPIAMTVHGVAVPPVAKVFKYADALTPLPDIAGNDFYAPVAVDITDIATETDGPCGLPPTAAYQGGTAGGACGNQKNSDTLGRLESSVQTTNPAHIVGVNLTTARGDTDSVPGNYSVVGFDPSVPAYNRALSAVAHELFHQFGLVHAGNECGGGQDNDSDDTGQTGEAWPPDGNGDLDGIGLDTTSEPYQFIAAGASQKNTFVPNGLTYGPGPVYDLMSYCEYAGSSSSDVGDWLSPRNWQQLIQNFGFTSTVADVARAAVAPEPLGAAPLATDAQMDPAQLGVTGFVTSTGVDITSVGPQVGGPSPPGTSADSFTMTALGSQGQVIATVPMAATTGGHIDGFYAHAHGTPPPASTTSPGSPLVQISGAVPAAGVDSIQIAYNGTVVATRTRPALAPSVKVLAPRRGARVGTRSPVLVRWSATSPEDLPLTASVDYSRDGGRTWRTIFVGPNDDHTTLPSFYFTAARRSRVRVRISDGFNETDAVSGVFSAAGAPPEVAIETTFSPRMPIAGDAQVQLAGQAVDQAEQKLSGRQLRWFDGTFPLGHGAELSAGPLPAGVNHLRLLARDPAGRKAAATLTVHVSAVQLPFLHLTIPHHASGVTRKLTLHGSSSVPATVTIGGHRLHLGRTSKTFSVPIGAGRSPLLLQVSVEAGGLKTPYAVRITR
jgi:hypothetical protein